MRIISLIILLIYPILVLSQNTKVTWYSFNMGFGEHKSGNIIIQSVVGQNFVGTTKQSNTQILCGFLADTIFRSRLVAVTDVEELPKTFALYQNYPNPFNPTTTIKYDLPISQHVVIKVYNLLGQEVITLVDEVQEPGYKSVLFGAHNLASGIYIYRIFAGQFSIVKKMLLVK